MKSSNKLARREIQTFFVTFCKKKWLDNKMISSNQWQKKCFIFKLCSVFKQTFLNRKSVAIHARYWNWASLFSEHIDHSSQKKSHLRTFSLDLTCLTIKTFEFIYSRLVGLVFIWQRQFFEREIGHKDQAIGWCGCVVPRGEVSVSSVEDDTPVEGVTCQWNISEGVDFGPCLVHVRGGGWHGAPKVSSSSRKQRTKVATFFFQ